MKFRLSASLFNEAISKRAATRCALYLLGLLMSISFSNLVSASQGGAEPVTLNPTMPSFSPPPPPPDRGAPGNRGGASGRGCGLGRQFVR
ncbi:MAG: hypothetical protein ACRDEA_13810, partial [Microcystaceae cyanobacterium]